jgi:flagellar protein FlbD
MIPVTRLDGTCIVLNVDLVQWVEETPDTVVVLSNGERLLVKESAGELVRRAIEFKRAVAAGPVVRDAGDPDAAGLQTTYGTDDDD